MSANGPKADIDQYFIGPRVKLSLDLPKNGRPIDHVWSSGVVENWLTANKSWIPYKVRGNA